MGFSISANGAIQGHHGPLGFFFFASDIGACEQIINKKNKGDFQEYVQTEHSKFFHDFKAI